MVSQAPATEGAVLTTDIEAIAACGARLAELEDHVSWHEGQSKLDVARLAELEAENATVIKRAADAIIQQEHRAERAEAERDAARREANISADNCNTAELSANSLRAERDAAWELVEELDPHHLKRNQMGLPREDDEG